MAASACMGEACAGTNLADPSTKHPLQVLGISRKNALRHDYGATTRTRLYVENNGLKLAESNATAMSMKACHGVVTGLFINKCSSSLKISSDVDLNAEIQYENTTSLICESSNGINSPPPTSPDSDDYYGGNMVAGHHLDGTSGAGHCYFSGILPSPSSCGDSFKSVSSPESEFAELMPPPDDSNLPSTLEDHHISSLCSLTVPDIFKTNGDIDDVYVTTLQNHQQATDGVHTRAKDQRQCYPDLRTECRDVPTVENIADDEEIESGLNNNLKRKKCDLDFRDKLSDLSTPDKTDDQNGRNSQVKCKWRGCDFIIKQSVDIVEHIRACHMTPQLNSSKPDSKFVCLWRDCKVYDKPSSSRSWLERHVMTHGGHKPFKCIVDSCEARFTSKNALERHVNSHFKISQNSRASSVSTDHKNGDAASTSSKSGSTKLSKDESPCKSRRKRTRFKRSWWKAKNEDFFDSGIMDHLRHRVMLLNKNTNIDISNSGHSITFHSQVIARRTEESGKVFSLVRWFPEDILPDSWESEASVQQEKSIPIRSLPHDIDIRNLLSLTPFTKSRTKRRRK